MWQPGETPQARQAKTEASTWDRGGHAASSSNEMEGLVGTSSRNDSLFVFFHRFSIANLLITQGNLSIYLHLLRLFVDIYLSLPMCLFAVDGFAAMLVKHGSFYPVVN